MPTNYVTDVGLGVLPAGLVRCGAAGDTLKLMFLGPGWTASRAVVNISEVAAYEIDCTGYDPGYGEAGRIALPNQRIEPDDTNHRAGLFSDAIVVPAIGEVAGVETKYALIVWEVGGSDATAIVLAVLDCVTMLYGGKLTLSPSSDGLVYWDS